MTTITILYPSGPAFDLDYYLKTHMSIVSENWTPEGLESYEILKFEPGLPYQIQATLRFKSATAWDQALSGPTSRPVLGDIPNFTEAKPVLLKGHKQA